MKDIPLFETGVEVDNSIADEAKKFKRMFKIGLVFSIALFAAVAVSII
jgi:hypothetical protein